MGVFSIIPAPRHIRQGIINRLSPYTTAICKTRSFSIMIRVSGKKLRLRTALNYEKFTNPLHQNKRNIAYKDCYGSMLFNCHFTC
jgi:hypothetical protein